MLNRRIIRIKVLQSFYGFIQRREVIFNQERETLSENFDVDLNTEEVQDKAKLSAQQELVKNIWDKWYFEKGALESDDKEVLDDLKAAEKRFNSSLKKETRTVHDLMIKDLDQLRREYLQLLSILITLTEFVNVEEQEKQSKRTSGSHSPNLKFLEFEPAVKLKEILEKSPDKLKQNEWLTDEEIVRSVFKKALVTNEVYKNYLTGNGEFDKPLLKTIYTDIIFENELIDNYFWEQDLYWHENKKILRGLCLKTVKEFNESETWKLLSISPNQEEDVEFMEMLFNDVVENDQSLEEIISKYLENWDMERVTLTDNLILKLALTEMLNFPGIPVKVTINEFIEISKLYSSPKSKQFINGLLDRISKELKEEGKIKKSGRGLIDNK